MKSHTRQMGIGSFTLPNAFLGLMSLVMLGLPLFSHAATDSLIVLTADDHAPGRLSVTTDSNGNLTGMQISGLQETGASPGTPRVVPISQLQNGSVLFETDTGVDIISIELSSGFSPQSGGAVDLVYTTNAITGARTKVTLNVSRGSAGDWVLTYKGFPVIQAKIVAGSLGVNRIDWSYDSSTRSEPLDRFHGQGSRGEVRLASISDRQQKGIDSPGSFGLRAASAFSAGLAR